jgi:CheY-like chemotaxis protein
VREVVNESLETLRNVEQEVRTLSYVLHPPLLDDLGLASTLRWFTEGIKKRSGLEVRVNIPEDFGRIGVDRELALFRVVQESLTNVLRHSSSSHAEVHLSKSHGVVKLTVEDQGKGMDSATLAKLRGGQETMGVGIPGIRERLRQLGGTLEVHSNKSGTKLVATVPSEKAGGSSRSTALPPGSRGTMSNLASDSAKTRVLIVDDYEVILHGVRALLSAEPDMEVCGEARSGLEAITMVKELNPDVVIMDLTMPNVGGLSAAYQIRQLGFQPKMLVFTTHEFAELEHLVRRAGCDGMLLKSDASTDLVRAVRTLMQGNQFFCDAG